MKKISQQIIIAVFILFIFFTGIFVVTLRKEEFSDIENRTLAAFPAINFSTIENKKAMDGIESYIADHFPLRTAWVTAKNSMEIFIGKREINGVYISDERLIQKVTIDSNIVNGNIDGINAFAARYNVPIFVTIIPTSAAVYPENIPEYAPNPDQKTFINDVYQSLDRSITTIDIFDILMANRENYIYYRTDHHWTTDGAFTAYQALGEELGFSPLDSESFDIETIATDFRGSLYSKVLYNGTIPDSVDVYHSRSGNKTKYAEIYLTIDSPSNVMEDLYIDEFLTLKNKYGFFFGGDRPLININTASEGGKILIFKDSYANCFVPFLTEHYNKITMLDMRYINVPLDEVVDVNEYDQVMFFYNVFSFNDNSNLLKLTVN